MANKQAPHGQPGRYNVTPATRSDGEPSGFEFDASGNQKITLATDIPYAQKITEGSGVTYVAVAPIGSAQASAVWQAKKITVSGADTVITWAGGGAFNQVATTLSTLTYA